MAKEKKAPAKKTTKSSAKKTQKKPLEDPLNKLIIDTILDKKGQNISLMDLRDVSGPTDYFIICEADNITPVSYTHLDVYKRQVLNINSFNFGPDLKNTT